MSNYGSPSSIPQQGHPSLHNSVLFQRFYFYIESLASAYLTDKKREQKHEGQFNIFIIPIFLSTEVRHLVYIQEAFAIYNLWSIQKI